MVNWLEIIGVDWKLNYYPALMALLSGHSPYVAGYYNPPWTLLPLIPLVLLPVAWGAAVLGIANFAAYAYVLARMRVNVIMAAVLVLLTSFNSINGNIEGLCALGFIMPPQIGLFFVLVKPQIGIGVAAYWAFNIYTEYGWRETLRTFAPVTCAYLLSFIVFGFWMSSPNNAPWNYSLWPIGPVFGLALMYLAVYKQKLGYAIAAGPFFSPYVNWFTWVIVIIGLLTTLPNGRKLNVIE